MKLLRSRLAVALGSIVLCSSASAQPFDHLKCFKISDTQIFDSAAADIETIEAAFPAQNCQIKKKAKYFCVPASKNVTAIVNGSDNPFASQELLYEQICYKITCPRVTIADQEISDQFGTRTVARPKASMLCVPAVIGPPPTTTTTTTSTTTTTIDVAGTWSIRGGDTLPQIAVAVAVDNAGNTIAVGDFEGAIDFGLGALTSAGGDDLFVVKLDPTGAPIWNKRFGDASDQKALAIAVDSADRIVLGGHFQGAVDFGGGSLASAGSNDVYLAQLDASGNHLWSKKFGGGANENGLAVVVTPSDDVIVAGSFASAGIDFGGGTISLLGSQDAYVARFDSAGTHVWSKGFGGLSAFASAFQMALDPSGNVLVTGFHSGTVDYGGGGLAASGSTDISAWKLTGAGSHVWSKIFGDASLQLGVGIATDAGGNVYLVSNVQGSANFGGSALTSAGSFDLAVAKLDSSGTHVWSQIYGDSASQSGFGITIDAAGDVNFATNFGGTIDFGGGPLTSLGGNDIAIVKLTSAGAHASSVQFGDVGDQSAARIETDPSNNRYICGQINGTVDFGSGALMSSGGGDAYVAKLAP